MADVIFIFHFGLFFALLPPPPNSPKNQNFKKVKKTPEDIINLHMCTVPEIWCMMDGQMDRQTYRSDI